MGGQNSQLSNTMHETSGRYKSISEGTSRCSTLIPCNSPSFGRIHFMGLSYEKKKLLITHQPCFYYRKYKSFTTQYSPILPYFDLSDCRAGTLLSLDDEVLHLLLLFTISLYLRNPARRQPPLTSLANPSVNKVKKQYKKSFVRLHLR